MDKVLIDLHKKFLAAERKYTIGIKQRLKNADYSNPTEGNQEAIGWLQGFIAARELLEEELSKIKE